MDVERQIEAEAIGVAVESTVQTIPTNLIGLGVVASALFFVAPLELALLIVGIRLLSIAFTHLNALRIRSALLQHTDHAGPVSTFLFSTAFGGFTWASIIFPIDPPDFGTFPGIVLVIVVNLAVAMVTLTFAPIPRAMPAFLCTFLAAVCAYFAWHYAALGLAPAVVAALLVFAVFSFGRRVAQSARDTARTKVENARLNRELQSALAEARRLSETDPLTGLANRRAFEREAERMRGLPANLPKHVLIVDLDHFKRVNDELGHAAGDELLCSVAAVLTATVVAKGRDVNLTARLGGEEFVLVLTGLGAREVDEAAERLRSEISVLGRDRRGRCPVSASIGIARWQSDEPVQAALSRADTAMYEAKSNGRDRVCMAA